MIDSDTINLIEFKLSVKILSVNTVGGGSINDVYCLHANHKKFLIKLNDAAAYPNMFKYECDGLEAIEKTGTIAVPEVILNSECNGRSFLLMTWINNRRPTLRATKLLGEQLSNLHRRHAAQFGLPYNNYMGSMVQSNKMHAKWSNFFIEERLMPQVSIAADNGGLANEDVKRFELLYKKLPDLFQEELPSLIHGDLWGGNYLVSEDDVPYLIDPAVTFGHREFDIAMTTLFGGFLPDFYDAYDEHFPLSEEWEQRIPLWNLYPLLIHLNLFGTGYLVSVRDNLARYI